MDGHVKAYVCVRVCMHLCVGVCKNRRSVKALRVWGLSVTNNRLSANACL